MSTKVQISKKLVMVNSASSLIARAIDVSILVWLQQYLLKRIGAEEYSIYPVLMAVMVFVPLFSAILTSGIGRFVVEAYAKGDNRGVTQIVSTMFVLLLGAGIAVLAGGLVFAWYVGDILTIAPGRLSDARIMMSLLMANAAAHLPLAPFKVGLYVKQKFVLQNFIQIGTEFLRIGLLFILLFGVSTRILWVIVASVSANFVMYVVLVGVSCRMIPALRFRISEIRWSRARELMSFGAWNFIMQLADTIRSSADPIILNKLATPVDVTSFYVGSLPYRQIQLTSYTVRRPLEPVMTVMHAVGAKEGLKNAYLRGGRYGLWASLVLAVPLMIYCREVIMLYVGEQYLAAATVMLLLLLATFPIGYGNVMMFHVAHAAANIRPLAICTAIMHGTNLALTLYFVGVLRMGAVGSALGTFCVMIVGTPVLLWPLARRLVDVKFSKWLRETVWPGMLPGIAGAALWLTLKFTVRPDSWLALGECAAAGWAVYGVVLFVFSLKPYDRQNLSAVLAKAKSYLSRNRVNV